MEEIEEKSDFIEVAKAIGAFGVRGFVRVVPLETGDALRSGKKWLLVDSFGNQKTLKPTIIQSHSGIFLVRFEGIDSKEAADACRGRILVHRSDFPKTAPGEFWAVDLVGASVINRSGKCLGKVSQFRSNGVQDILVVLNETGSEHLIPMIKNYIDSVDVDKHVIDVDWEEDWG